MHDDDAASMADAHSRQDAEGDGEESEQEVGAQGGDGAQSGCGALLRVRAKLIAGNCDVGAAVAVAEGMQHGLQGLGSITRCLFKEHLTKVIETTMHSRLIHGHTAKSAGEVVAAMRQCHASYPGAPVGETSLSAQHSPHNTLRTTLSRLRSLDYTLSNSYPCPNSRMFLACAVF